MSLHASTVELNRSFRRGFTLTFAADLLTKCVAAVTVVVLIRGLSVSAYAYATLFLTLAQFAGAAAGGGVRTRYLRAEAESVSRGVVGDHDGLFLISLVKGVVLILAVGLVVLPIAGALHLGSKFGAGADLILYSVAFAAGYGAAELAIAHYQARRRFLVAGALSLARAVALLVAAIAISVTHQSVQVLSLSFIASMVLVGLVAAAPVARNAFGKPLPRPRSLGFNREESWLSLYYLAAAGFAYVDVLVASALLNQNQVATLGASLRYLTIALAATPSLGAILRVRTAQVDMIDSAEAQRLMVLRWVRGGFGPIALCVACLVVLAPWGIPILSGGRYPESVTVFQVFLLTAASAYLFAPAASVLMAQRRYSALAWIFIAGLSVNLVGDIIVAPRFGVIGIAVVSSLVYLCVDLVMTADALMTAAGVSWARPRFSRGSGTARRRILEIGAASVVALILAIVIAGPGSGTGAGGGLSTAATTAKAPAAKGPPSPRWYSPTSLWNTPIGPNPTIAPNNATLIAALEKTPAVGVANDYTPAIWYAHRGTPKVPVRIDSPRCGAAIVWVPVPKGAVPDPSSEGHMVIAQYGTNAEFDFYKAQSPHKPPKSSVYYSRPCPTVGEWTAAKVTTTNWRTGRGELLGGTRGSGTPDGAGTILPRDTQMPAGATWDHALGMAYRNTCSDHMSWCPVVAPATQEDGVCIDQASCVPEGVRMQLDPAIDCNTWPSLKYTWQRQMCRTLQVYGGIISDSNEGGPTIPDQWHGSLIRYTWPWLRQGNGNLPRDLLAHFRFLAWQ
jgi:O-antigen/teichoic acid export membrane protein